MLHLKRASAGSGKTYQLAKTYIRDLISEKEKGKRRQLRSPESLREALTSIMAVTFTVKATAEMKQRIVSKLAALAMADKKSPEKRKEIDYLSDFLKEISGATVETIALQAQRALRVLLLHYSDFKVQTIDSFFQSVLHTFAYEASLDDNFNLEIDSDYMASVGFDAALDSITENDESADEETLFWLHKMMSEKKDSNKWNVFQRTGGKKTVYGNLISNAKNLEREDFQNIRGALDKYFSTLKRPFREVVAEVEEANLAPYRPLYDRRAAAGRDILDILDKAGLTPGDIMNSKGSRVVESVQTFDTKILFGTISIPYPKKLIQGWSLSDPGKKRFNTIVAKDSGVDRSILNDLDAAMNEWLEANNQLKDLVESTRTVLNTWLKYRKIIPKLMVVLEIGRKKKEYLETTNSLEISDTTRILARIIGDSDTPFVYERLGSRLDHYLIDEFQDTSRLQWNNLRPLLMESEGRDEDNLIIGDAKQSIYRFRNADYRLITETVEQEYRKRGKKVVPYTGDDKPAEEDLPKENTNFRSKAKIVKFNNYVFSTIPWLTEDDDYIFTPGIQAIYEGCEQFIPSNTFKKDLGYVDLTLYQLTSKEKEDEDWVGNVSLAEPGFQRLPSLIKELKERGYDYRDIGVLVRTRAQASATVKMITRYNTEHPLESIPVISEENQLVASALSVKLIIRALEIAVKGEPSKIRENPVLEDPIDEVRLFDMLDTLQSPSLPSIVEAIIDEFIPEQQRNADTPFLATFQDAVLDYCASKTSDIGSFLKWWKRKATSLSINSPEESDGVRIHTIHGSKGLEYKCVIMPMADIKFAPSSQMKEWKWVVPDGRVAKADLLPPFMPVETEEALSQTLHALIWERHREEVTLDELNKLYVGFTRAVNELYAWLPFKSSSNRMAADALSVIFEDGLIKMAEEKEENLTVIHGVDGLEDAVEYRYGKPLTLAEIEADRNEQGTPAETLETYEVHSKGKLLRFEDANPLLLQEKKGKRKGKKKMEDPDPRAEGTLKHRVMQMVERPEDLDRALLMMRVEGLISNDELKEWKAQLSEAIASVKEYGWFDADVKVLNERSLLYSRGKALRPDRMMIMPDGRGVIVDYKFGNADPEEYREQVAEYAARLLSTGACNSVESYLWYVTQGKVEPVGNADK